MSRYVLDARGREVRCIGFNEAQRLAGAARGRIDVRAIRARSPRDKSVSALILIWFWLWVIVGVFAFPLGIDWLKMLWFLALFAFGIANIVSILVQERLTPKLFYALLDARICPHCAYDLAGQSEHDNAELVTCPECACVWRIGAPD